MSTIKVNSIEPANAGSEDYFLCKAWVSLNGSGTAAIRGSGNIASVTDNGVGNYTFNFTNALADANYSVVQAATGPVSTHHVHGYIGTWGSEAGTYSTSAFQVSYYRDENSGNRADPAKANWQVMR